MNKILEERKILWDEINKEKNPLLLLKLAKTYLEEHRMLRALYLLKRCLKETGQNTEEAKKLVAEIQQLSDLKGKIPGISLCMIVKNEEKNLANCIRSADPYVDEIIVIDTGSTDSTIEIAENLGARVEKFEWNNDFSAARNFSIKFALCQWILWLDADDFVPEGQEHIINIIKKSTLDRSFFTLVCSFTGPNEVSPPEFRQLRIFPNLANIYFEQSIHEQIAPSITHAGIQMMPIDFHIHHMGYHNDTERKNKAKRNIKMAQKEIEKNPNNFVLIASIGDSFYVCEEYEEAAKAYEKSISVPNAQKNDEQVFGQTYVRFIYSLVKLNSEDKALKYLEKLLLLIPNKADALSLAGDLYYKSDNFKKAEEYYLKVMDVPEIIGTATVNFNNIKRNALLKLSGIYVKQNRFDDVLKFSRMGMERFPNVLDFWVFCADALFYLKRYPEAFVLYEKSVNASPNTANQAYAGKASCLLLAKNIDEAEEVLTQGYLKFPEDIRIIGLLGDIYYHKREPYKSLDYYKKIIEKDKNDIKLFWKAASCAADINLYTESLEYIREIIRLDPHSKEAKAFAKELERLIYKHE